MKIERGESRGEKKRKKNKKGKKMLVWVKYYTRNPSQRRKVKHVKKV